MASVQRKVQAPAPAAAKSFVVQPLLAYFGDGIDAGMIMGAEAYAGEKSVSLKLMKEMPFDQTGWTVEKAKAGRETLFLAAHGSPTSMGGMNAFQLCRYLLVRGLDNSKINKIHLISCSVGADAKVSGSETFAQSLIDEMVKDPALQGIDVYAALGPLYTYAEAKDVVAPQALPTSSGVYATLASAPTSGTGLQVSTGRLSEAYVVLPDGKRVAPALGFRLFRAKQPEAYEPPAAYQPPAYVPAS